MTAVAAPFAYRPLQLRGVRDAFAIVMRDRSMEPRFRPRHTLWVHPGVPVKPGDDVLVVLDGDAAFVRELVTRDAKRLELLAHNPTPGEEKVTTVDAALVRSVYRVIGSLSFD